MNERTELVGRADDGPCGEIKDAVRSLKNIQVRPDQTARPRQGK
jgi:hypothetical protein